MGPLGKGFVEDARKANRLVYVWTVNEPNLMRWCIRRGIDAVMTDDPVLFGAISTEWKGQQKGFAGGKRERATLLQKLKAWGMSVLVVLFGWAFKLKYLTAVERVRFEKAK